MKRTLKSYRDNKSGQFAIWLGLSALPLLASVTFAVDLNGAERSRTELKAALDSAALAAVSNQTLTPEARKAYAISYFEQNFSDADEFSAVVTQASAERVSIEAIGQSPVTVSRAFGHEGITIKERSIAVLNKQDVICVLTLDPEGEESFSVTDGSDFKAPNCSVQVNSIHPKAAMVDVGSSASAKSFCTAGGAEGGFFPFVNTECSVVSDPFMDVVPPQPGLCIHNGKLEFKIDKVLEESKYGNLFKDELVAVVGNMVTLTPGTYCQKLEVEGYDVTFLPGTYIMKDASIEFTEGAQATARGVTFVLHGKKSKFKIDSGSSVYIKAPTEGALAGLAIMQDKDAVLKSEKDDDKKDNEKDKVKATGKSELKGGSSMDIIGTVYLPTQELIVGSGSGLGTHAPATSFIGYSVAFEGGAVITIDADHESEDLPPLVPRSDDSARLIQ